MPVTRRIAGRDWWLRIVCWSAFAAGVAIHFFAPHLAIQNGAFVIPPEMVSGGQEIVPADLINQQRYLELLAAALTVGGAFGLAFLYFRRPRAP